eukprot:4873315-Pleurochrysis_carterae.AAC.1
MELAEFGDRLAVGFGWSPHDGWGLAYRSFLLELQAQPAGFRAGGASRAPRRLLSGHAQLRGRRCEG